MQTYDVIIIGAGAAGLMCAISAANRGRRVLVLDHAERVGKKILISGGGRCNFTNLELGSERYVSANPDFCRSALSRYTQYDFIALVERHGVAYHEKTLGQLFCDGKSRAIVDLLLDECAQAGVAIRTGCKVQAVGKSEAFEVATTLGDVSAPSLVVATGGLSFPRMGATGLGYKLAKQFGLNVLPQRPGLVPLTLRESDVKSLGDLSGVSVAVRVSCGNVNFREAMLFTHKGLSGPAILQISNYWHKGDELLIDLLPDADVHALIDEWRESRPKAELRTLLGELIGKRLARCWFDQGLPNKPVRQYTSAEIEAVAAAFHQWRITPSGTEGYARAEVTLGGVDTREVSSKTFEANAVPGLYFIGEVLDVTGWLGGFNFQWAWASGYCAGQYV